MGLSINNPVGSIIDLIKDGLDKFGPADKTVVAQAKATLDTLKESDAANALASDIKIQLAGLDNVKAEAQGNSWLQRNWRPVSALTFVGLIVAYWFGWTAPNLSPSSIDWLFKIIEMCLGGYTVGRSAEKIASVVAPILKK